MLPCFSIFLPTIEIFVKGIPGAISAICLHYIYFVPKGHTLWLWESNSVGQRVQFCNYLRWGHWVAWFLEGVWQWSSATLPLCTTSNLACFPRRCSIVIISPLTSSHMKLLILTCCWNQPGGDFRIAICIGEVMLSVQPSSCNTPQTQNVNCQRYSRRPSCITEKGKSLLCRMSQCFAMLFI